MYVGKWMIKSNREAFLLDIYSDDSTSNHCWCLGIRAMLSKWVILLRCSFLHLSYLAYQTYSVVVLRWQLASLRCFSVQIRLRCIVLFFLRWCSYSIYAFVYLFNRSYSPVWLVHIQALLCSFVPYMTD